MKHLILPEPIAAYFEADKQDGSAVARCFTKQGKVTDEGRSHVGTAGIEAWKTQASAQFTYTVEPISYEQKGRQAIVSARVEGNFPGSPVVLNYTFVLERGKILTLEVAP